MVPVAFMTIAKAIVEARDTAMETFSVKGSGMKSVAVKSGKATAVEPAMKAAAMETPSATVRHCAGEIRLAENRRAQQRGCEADYEPPFPRRARLLANSRASSRLW
jgi:hypothetical protein